MPWTIPCGPSVLELGARTYVMGVLNVTPDSFSDGGRFLDVEAAVARALEMAAEGADIIDIGGESTRPGHSPVSPEEELRRVLPVLQRLRGRLSVPLSIDTWKAEVAREALRAGAHMLNDVWGLRRDPAMARVAAEAEVPVVVMHNQEGNHYERPLMEEIIAVLRRSIDTARAAGIPEERIIVDPGIGFGKTALHNLEVLAHLSQLKSLGRPILLGTSRKSFIGKILGGLPPEERVEGTLASVAIGIAGGADIVRVHDVRQCVRAARVADAIVRPGRGGFTGG